MLVLVEPLPWPVAIMGTTPLLGEVSTHGTPGKN
jgi:hypothetical protein